MKRWEDYLQPNGTLRNKWHITDDDRLQTLEYLVSARQQKFLEQNDFILPDGYQLMGVDVTELKRINRFLLGDIYDWAGEYREVDFTKSSDGVVTHFHPVILFGNAEWDIQRQLNDYVKLSRDQDVVATTLGELITAINMFHPFREGNGRTLRIFLAVLVQQKGYRLQLTASQQAEYMATSVADSATQMTAVLRSALLEN
ncbi:Fic/DOC family protein [Levilactobacillus parabrevis]|uniref:Fic/DOC family protein n=1 Tax=Levilactobacillus parabrevis TaxID=357278 RepID=UPI003756DD1A